jgi:hypothetical protein
MPPIPDGAAVDQRPRPPSPRRFLIQPTLSQAANPRHHALLTEA